MKKQDGVPMNNQTIERNDRKLPGHDGDLNLHGFKTGLHIVDTVRTSIHLALTMI